MKETFKKFGSKIAAGVTAVGTALGASITALAEGPSDVADVMESSVATGASSAYYFSG